MPDEERISAMKKFIASMPNNPFPRYALALEYKSAGRSDDAVATFEELITLAPDYVASYLQFGMLLEDLGRIEQARTVLVRGAEVARAKGDGHTLSEIEGALAGLD